MPNKRSMRDLRGNDRGKEGYIMTGSTATRGERGRRREGGEGSEGEAGREVGREKERKNTWRRVKERQIDRVTHRTFLLSFTSGTCRLTIAVGHPHRQEHLGSDTLEKDSTPHIIQ